MQHGNNAFGHTSVHVGPVCAVTCESLDLETYFLVCAYIVRMSRSRSCIKVIGSRSHVREVIEGWEIEKGQGPQTIFVQEPQVPNDAAACTWCCRCLSAFTHYSYCLMSCHCVGSVKNCLLYTSPSPRDRTRSRMPSSA